MEQRTTPSCAARVPRGDGRLLTPWRLALIAVLAASVVPYLRALRWETAWDDDSLIDGTAVGGGASLAQCFTRPFLSNYYRPLVSASFVLERRAFGTTALFYHQTNILLHLATTALLVGLLLQAFRSRRVALAGALLFAVQPVQTGTVAWIGGRTDSLCALWMAAFAWALVAAADWRGSGGRRWALLVVAATMFGLAVFTKEQVIAALPLVPLAFYCFRGNMPSPGRRTQCIYALPFLTVAFAFVAAWLWVWPVHFHPALQPALVQAGTAGRTITYYALVLLAPAPRWLATQSLDALQSTGIVTVGCGFAIAAAAVVLFRRWLRSAPAAAWMLGFVVLTLLPIANLAPLAPMVVAPWRAGVAGLGAAALLGWWFASAGVPFRPLPPAECGRRAELRRFWLPATGAVVACYWLCMTWWGVSQWRDLETACRTFVRYDPNSLFAHNNLSVALMRAGHYGEAERDMERVLNQLFGGRAWDQPGAAMRALAADPRIERTVESNASVEIPAKDSLAQVFSQLGMARLRQHAVAAARRAYETAALMEPQSVGANEGLGACAAAAADYRSAVRYYSFAVAGAPGNPDLLRELGEALLEAGRPADAQTTLRSSLRAEPWMGITYVDLAEAKLRTGDVAGARADLEAAARCPVRVLDTGSGRVARLTAEVERRTREAQRSRT